MRRFRPLLVCALVCAVTACHQGAASPGASAAPTAEPSMLIDDRGVTMPLADAVSKIAYHPWIPPRTIYKYAVIPPLGDLDTPDHRGIAMEYAYGKSAMVLSEWPKQHFTLLFLHGNDITYTPCTIAHYKVDGVAWTTRGKLAMTLQPDGSVNPRAVDTEARALIAAGACR